MREILVTFFLIVSVHVSAQNAIESNAFDLEWQQNYSDAVTIAKKENKPLLIFFTGSDWCSPCKMLVDDLFTTTEFYNFAASKFIFYKADFPRNKDLVAKFQQNDNSKLKSRFNISTFPTIVVVNGKERELGRKKSYNLLRDTSYHYQFLKDVLKK